jgi:hypothetical protein
MRSCTIRIILHCAQIVAKGPHNHHHDSIDVDRPLTALSRQVMAEDPRWKDQSGDLAPERFCPERWLDPAVIESGAGSWIPWGGGARMCLGMNLAMAQMKVRCMH